MSPGVPVDARLVSAGDPLFHCPWETYSERLAMGIGTCSWRFAKCRISSGHERARTGARGWWSHRILHPSSRCLCKSLQSCPTLCDPMEPSRLLCPWDSPGKNTGVGGRSLLEGLFPDPRLRCGQRPGGGSMSLASQGTRLRNIPPGERLWTFPTPGMRCTLPPTSLHQLLETIRRCEHLREGAGVGGGGGHSVVWTPLPTVARKSPPGTRGWLGF